MTVTDPEMTRFMMNLETAVDLVLFAFKNARPGDRFVQKAPAASIGVLAEAVKRLLKADNPIKVIGTRHGEKLYETLLTREEAARAEDLGEYFRVPADNRDLNYNIYFCEGTTKLAGIEDYHSNNARRLDLEQMMDLLLTLPEMQAALARRALGAKGQRIEGTGARSEDQPPRREVAALSQERNFAATK